MQRVSAEDFRDAFEAAWRSLSESALGPEARNAFENGGRRWTRVMLGAPGEQAGQALSVIARAFEILNRGRESHLDLDLERHKVDAFGRVRRMNWQDSAWPDHVSYLNMLMIEVENRVEDSIEEFWKFVHYRIPLKVLVTYDYCRKDNRAFQLSKYDELRREAEVLLGPDVSDYLVIFGGREDETARDFTDRGEIKWRYFKSLVGSAYGFVDITP